MITTELIEQIKLLDSDYRNGTALTYLMDWSCKSNLRAVTQEEAEIFYMLYDNIIYNSLNINLHRRK